MEVDEALDKVGGYGRWHVTIFIYLCASLTIPLCYQDINIVFLGYEPPHHCKVPDNSTFNASIPYHWKDGEVVIEKCSMYVNDSLGNVTKPCDNGWTYHSGGYRTIVTEWDLVCENNYFTEVSQVMYQMFALAGDLIISFMIDRFGRRPIHMVGTGLIAVAGISVSFSTNYIMFAIMRSVTAFVTASVYISAYTMMMELFDSKRRSRIGILLEFPWVVVYLLLPLWAWLMFNWRHLQLFTSILSFMFLIDFWILPESVPWLVVTGRYEKAEQLLKKMAKWNGRDVGDIKLKRKIDVPLEEIVDEKLALKASFQELNNPDDVTEPSEEKVTNGSPSPKDDPPPERDVTLKDTLLLFTDPKLRVHTFVGSFMWFADWIVYFCLILVSPTLAGNRFVNFFIMGLVEIPAYTCTLFIVTRFGRRLPTCFFHIATAVLLIIVVLLPKKTASGVDLQPLATTLVISAKFTITSAFAIIVLYTRELFPTNLRATSTGVMNVIGRFGNLIAPMTAYATKSAFPWLPSVIMAGVSVLVGLLVLLLPETNNKPLPLTLADVYKLYETPYKAGKKADKSGKDAKKKKADPIYKPAVKA